MSTNIIAIEDMDNNDCRKSRNFKRVRVGVGGGANQQYKYINNDCNMLNDSSGSGGSDKSKRWRGNRHECYL